MPLYKADDLRRNPPKPIPSIVGKGLFPECGTWLITGITGSGKSLLAFDICLSLVLQQPLFRAFRKKHGQQGKPYFPVHRPCKILYLDNEIGETGCHERLNAFCRDRKIDVDLGEYFQIVTGEYDSIHIHATGNDKKSYLNLAKLLDTVKPDILIVDPLGDYHLEDEDSNKMRLVIRDLRTLQKTYKFASILLHHESDKQFFSRDGFSVQKEGTGRARGHSSLAQSVDTMLAIRKHGKGKEHFLEISWEKARHQAPPPVGYLFVDTSRMHIEWFCSSKEHGIPAKQQAFLDAYKANRKLTEDDDEDED